MGAVFGGAARVPIATLLMVTEMTGGYQLLVPAALSVMLSSWVQNLLSSQLKYKSLYEAQVPNRAYSPAHYTEQLRLALEMLKTRGLPSGALDRGLELISLLTSGVPFKLPGEAEIRIGTLRPDSPWVDHQIPHEHGVEFIIIMRGGRMLLPDPEVRLQPGDQLVAIAAQPEWTRMKEHLDSISKPLTPSPPEHTGEEVKA
jgi:CIC family chloride channel protein